VERRLSLLVEMQMKSVKLDNGVAREGAAAVEAYLAKVPEPARSTLEKVRATIRSVVPPETTEGLSYGIPAFRYNGGLVGYAAFKNHCSFFPMQASLIDAMKEDLKGYRTSKGTLQFEVDKPLPSALVKKMVKARVAENEQKKTK
jgi:uncharacterized protein YdhG (YjbR/CyaY superfamily)